MTLLRSSFFTRSSLLTMIRVNGVLRDNIRFLIKIFSLLLKAAVALSAITAPSVRFKTSPITLALSSDKSPAPGQSTISILCLPNHELGIPTITLPLGSSFPKLLATRPFHESS